MTASAPRFNRTVCPQSAVLLFALAIAVLGIFPFGILYGFPILASLTLRDAPRWLRTTVCAVSMALFAVTVVVDVAKV